MKVGLAKDVLSWNVGKCLEADAKTKGTAEFILLFDKWVVSAKFGLCGD